MSLFIPFFCPAGVRRPAGARHNNVFAPQGKFSRDGRRPCLGARRSAEDEVRGLARASVSRRRRAAADGEANGMGGFAEFARFDGLGLAELVRRGEVAPIELVEEAIARIEARNPALNAVVSSSTTAPAPRRAAPSPARSPACRSCSRISARRSPGRRPARATAASPKSRATPTANSSPAIARPDCLRRQDQRARIRPCAGHRAGGVRPLPQPLGPRAARRAARAAARPRRWRRA